VTIPTGTGPSAIAERLKAAGLIRSTLAFDVLGRVRGTSRRMKAGEYELPRNLDLYQVIDRLVAGVAETAWVVIPEGKKPEEIAAILQEANLVQADAFLRAVEQPPAKYGLRIPTKRRSVDGYLMPDTYRINRKTTPPRVIEQMVKNWEAKVYRPNRDAFARCPLSIDQVIVAASLIEREARVPQDRPLIASVIRNRLKRKMPLQIDATVIYALGHHKQALTFADLKVDSPYNTYRHTGLPPGPICEPGAEAVKAFLYPPRTDYLYYVARPDGRHIFTRTRAEHHTAIVRARALRAAQRR
jgi:UPF0755 protein